MNPQTLMTEMTSLLRSMTSPSTAYRSEMVLSAKSKMEEAKQYSANQIIYLIVSVMLAVDAENKERDIPNTLRIDEERVIGLTQYCLSLKPEPEPEPDEEVFECETCNCDLDPNDLIHSYHNNTSGLDNIYQCADCFDADKEAEEADEDEEDDC